MWITKLNYDAWLIEAHQLRVIADPPLTTTTSEECADFFRATRRPHALILRDFPPVKDERLWQLARIFEDPAIFVVGGAGSVARLRARGLRRIFHLGAYQFLNFKGLRFMGVPTQEGPVADGYVIAAGNASVWFQGSQSPSSEIAWKTRIYLRRPLSVVVPPSGPALLPSAGEAYARWQQGVLGARADEIMVPANEYLPAIRAQLLKADSQLHLREYFPQQRLHFEGRETELARHLSPWSVRRLQRQRPSRSRAKTEAPSPSRAQLTSEERRQALIRLIEVQLHLEFLKQLYEERRSPLHEWMDRRAVMQIEIALEDGQRLVWHFARWYPRCEIGFGPHPQAEVTFRYDAGEVFDFATGAVPVLSCYSGSGLRGGWHPLQELKGIWRKSLTSPLLPDSERDHLLYRI